MLLLADENIPFAREAFGALGEVQLVAGRAITRNIAREAEALLVRSVTTVNAAFLEGSRVKFVGTATIGTDHIDLDYLRQKGIAFASAAGCNANAVAEYIVAALLHVAAQRQIVLEGLTLGIVGTGNVGSRVAQKARVLGLKVLLNDPPLAALLYSTSRQELTPALQPNLARLSVDDSSPQFCSLKDLMRADFLTLHTPLVRSGPYPTFHLFDEIRLGKMKPGSVLLNTARGEVVDNLALKKILRSGLLSGAILDVWEHEPHLDPELAELAALATPHVAGYSFDGKLRGTLLIYEALCCFLQIVPSWNYEPLLPLVSQPEIDLREDEFNAPNVSQKIPPLRGPGGCYGFINYPDDAEWRHHGATITAVTHSGEHARVEEHPPGPPQGRNIKLLHEAVRHAYDIVADDARLRAGMLRADCSKEERGKFFDKLRHEYPMRREFHNYRIQLPYDSTNAQQQLLALGFHL